MRKGVSITLSALLISSPLMAKKKEVKKTMGPLELIANVDSPDVYTINFNNVSMVEFIKFVSETADVNFVYNEEELGFNITITSDAPTPLSNIVAALTQMLRVRGFQIMEQGRNLVIYKNLEVNQIATVVAEEVPFTGKLPPAIVTRVFRLKNQTPTRIVELIKPMLSGDALIEPFDETRQLIVTDNTPNVDKIAQLLLSLDANHLALEVDAFTVKEGSAEELITVAQQIMTPMAEGNPVIMIPQKETRSIYIISTPYLIERTMGVLEDLDMPTTYRALKGENVLLYKVKFKSIDVIEATLQEMVSAFEKEGYATDGLVEAIDSMRYIQDSHALVFTGAPETLKSIQDLLTVIDSLGKLDMNAHNATFFIYKPKYRTLKEISKGVDEIIDNLQKSKLSDPAFLFTLESMKTVDTSNSIVFTGDQNSIDKVKEILPSVDAPTKEQKKTETIGEANEFYLYTPKFRTGEELVKAVDDVAEDLQESELADPALLRTLENVRWQPSSNSLLFTGDSETLSRVKLMMPSLDSASADQIAEVYLHRIKYVNAESIQEGLNNIEATLPKDTPLAETIATAKYLPNTHSFAFRGPTESITRIKEVLAIIDSPLQAKKEVAETKTYYIYKLQNATGSTVIEYLDRIKKNLKSSDLDNRDVIDTIKNIEWIKSTNSIYISGTPEAIDQVKELIAEFDEPSHAKASNFFMYKPKSQSPRDLQKTLVHIAEDLEKANLADPSLLNTITTMRYVKKTESLLFTGTQDSLQKVQELLTTVDVPSEDLSRIQQLGPTTFLIYTPKSVPAPQLMNSIRAVTTELKDATKPNEVLIEAIKSMRYVSETKSLIFTGPEKALEQIQVLLDKFDIPSLAPPIQTIGQSTFLIYQPKYVTPEQLMDSLESMAKDLSRSPNPDEKLIDTIDNMRFAKDSKSVVFTGPSGTLQKIQQLVEKFDNASLATGREPEGYLLYSPKYQHGEELIQTLRDFEQNLVNSGIEEKALFDVINNLSWMDKTCSILVSGEEEAINSVQELLQKFDVPSADAETQIETFDDISFLLYKLQYHKGDQLEEALKKIALDLQTVQSKKESSSETTQDLIEAINSVQWIQITNSLVGTGKPGTLGKLKELLKSLDVPLRQVYIEVLVISTNITNSLDLGLRWGSQGNYMKKFSYSTTNLPSFSEDATDPALGFNQSLANISATNPPTGQDIPFTSGFDLGVIGDIITHKGQSYYALGSFLNAAKEDGDISIVLNQKIVTQDGKNSTLFIGENLPFTGSLVTNEGSNTVTTSNIEYRDIGVSLSITPTLGDDDVISLEIDQEITQDISTPDDSSGDSGSTVVATGISTSKTTTVTNVTVPDRHFLVLSGMITDNTTRNRQSIPCLGGLPVIGLAFQDTTSQIVKNNVIIFLKPHILDSAETWKQITAQEEALYRSQAAEEVFDAAIDLVKTPEDEF